ncbi:hypothetical protein GS438_21235 [Rhodococcus hoagii]|nr:hypothetical protein [Prescottella equi]
MVTTPSSATPPTASIRSRKLATSWTVSEDSCPCTGVARRRHLPQRQAVHLGGVESSIRDVRRSGPVGQLARTAALVTGFDTSDPHAITLTLPGPPATSSTSRRHADHRRRHTADLDTGKGYNGTGAFRFAAWKPGASITSTPTNSTGTARRTSTGGDVIVPDAQTRVSQLRSGQLDLMLNVAPRDAEPTGRRSRFPGGRPERVQRTPTSAPMCRRRDSATSGFARRSHAVDRDRIVADVYQGHGDLAKLPWPQYSPAFDAD